MKIINFPLLALIISLLVACGGGDTIEVADDTDIGDTSSDDLVSTGPATNVSYLPLMVLGVYKDWSGFAVDNQFYSYSKPSYITQYLINPVNATTLEPISTAKASDFDITEDGIPLNPMVNFPLLQKVIGNSVQLKTAIVINTSSAMDDVDRVALITEIKAFIEDAKSHSDSRIANQAFTVWGFDGARAQGEGGIVDETLGFKSSVLDVQSAVDAVSSKWDADAYEISGSNHTYDAIIEAIGRFVGIGSFKLAEDLRDTGAATDNDLFDYFTPDSIEISNVIVFSSGFASTNRFDGDFLIKAMESQALLTFDKSGGPGDATKYVSKSMIYVVPDSGVVDSVIKGFSDSVIAPELSGGEYTFSESLISAQQAAINKRVVPENQYSMRFASAIRGGDGHERIFATRTGEDSYSYSLTSDVDRNDAAVPMPDASCEITGANNEYLSAGISDFSTEYNSAIAYFDQIQTFYPATRWTNTIYTSSDYSWDANGADVTNNDDGSITVLASSTFPVTLELTNTVLTDTFTVTVNEAY